MNLNTKHHTWRKQIMEPLILLAFVVGWFVLQIWILPKMGVRT